MLVSDLALIAVLFLVLGWPAVFFAVPVLVASVIALLVLTATTRAAGNPRVGHGRVGGTAPPPSWSGGGDAYPDWTGSGSWSGSDDTWSDGTGPGADTTCGSGSWGSDSGTSSSDSGSGCSSDSGSSSSSSSSDSGSSSSSG